MTMAELEPKRYTDPTHGLLSKVFIAYPHNPQVYQWIPPPPPMEKLQQMYPGYPPDELKKMHEMQVAEVTRRKKEVEVTIEQHKKLVHNFARFLDSCKIAVAYDGLLLDKPVASYMDWFQKQMEDSDYIILIITDSFCHFLSNEVPPDKEQIFVGYFMHNVVHNPGKTILPVFLNRPVNYELLPDALKACSTYHVVATRESPYFGVSQADLSRLCALLTKQNRIVPPSQSRAVPTFNQGRRGEDHGYS